MLLAQPFDELESEACEAIFGSHDNASYASFLDAFQKGQKASAFEVETGADVVALVCFALLVALLREVSLIVIS